MNNIECMFQSYEELLEEFSEGAIRDRYAFLYAECEAFLKSMDLQNGVRIDEVLLMQTVLDYFADVSRLKRYHRIHHINEIKVLAYESFWLLRRKPLQLYGENRTDDFWSFVNEKFVFSRIASFLVKEKKSQILREADKKAFLNFLDTLYYFLKYRQYDAQGLELLVLGFRAGELWGRE